MSIVYNIDCMDYMRTLPNKVQPWENFSQVEFAWTFDETIWSEL